MLSNRIISLLFVLVFGSFLFYYFHQTNWQAVCREVTDFGAYFFVILCTCGCSYLCATIAWRELLYSRDERNENSFFTNIFTLFNLRLLGETISLITPANVVGGELFKLSLLRSEENREAKIASSLLMSRMILIAAFIFIAVFTLWSFIGRLSPSAIWGCSMSIVAFLIASIYVFKYIGSVGLYIFSPIFGEEKVHGWIEYWYTAFVKMQQTWHSSPRECWIAFVFSLLHWIFGAVEFYVILSVLDVPIDFFDAMVFEYGLVLFKSLGAFVPLQLGVEEYGNMTMLQLLNITSGHIWLTVSVIRRARQLSFISLSVFIYFIYKSIPKWKYYL